MFFRIILFCIICITIYPYNLFAGKLNDFERSATQENSSYGYDNSSDGYSDKKKHKKSESGLLSFFVELAGDVIFNSDDDSGNSNREKTKGDI